MYQVHRHKTEPRRFFIYEQYKDDAALEAHRAAPHFLQMHAKICPRSRTAWKGICSSRWGRLQICTWRGHSCPRLRHRSWLRKSHFLVDHQLAAGS